MVLCWINLFQRDKFILMNTKLSAIIRTRRKELGVDQKTLGRISGVSTHALSDLESGKGNPTLSTLLRILDALGLELHATAKSPGGDYA